MKSCKGYIFRYEGEVPTQSVKLKTKYVKQFNLGSLKIINIFESVKDAVEYIGVSRTSISKCCRHETHSSAGFGWEYIDN